VKTVTFRLKSKKLKVNNLILCLLTFTFAVTICGCAELKRHFRDEELPVNEQISDGYHLIEVKESTSADVLSVINLFEYELISKSKSVIASAGENKKGHKIWLKMAAFEEEKMTVQRKYLLIMDEWPKELFVEPKERLSLYCEVSIPRKVLDKPYADENARQIAILKQVLEISGEDIFQVSADNKIISVCGGLINQALQSVITQLEQSPALAAYIEEPGGLIFSHASLDKARAWMDVTSDIATIEITAGSHVKTSEDQRAEYDAFDMRR
jgi:hypothetical protein